MASRAKAATPQGTVLQGWPLDEDGDPMIQISMACSHLVPTGKYANATIGPAQVTRFVQDGDKDEIKEELDTLGEIVKEYIGEESEALINTLKDEDGKS